jgi:hypothetical protein
VTNEVFASKIGYRETCMWFLANFRLSFSSLKCQTRPPNTSTSTQLQPIISRPMATMNRNGAAHRCFMIFEILEAILLDVGMKTLLVSAQRVNRHWHNVIQNSLYLQRELFFEPEPPGSPVAFNVALIDVFPFCFPHRATLTRRPISRNVWPMQAITITHLNPFPDIPKVRRNLKGFSHPNASWRRMLVRQPPVCAVGPIRTSLLYRNMNTETIHPAWKYSTETEPLRMENLLRKVIMYERPNDAYYASSFRVVWHPITGLSSGLPLERYLNKRLNQDIVAVIQVVDHADSFPLSPNILLLRSVILG